MLKGILLEKNKALMFCIILKFNVMRNFLLMAAMTTSLLACNRNDDVDDQLEITGNNSVTLTVNQKIDAKGVNDQKGAQEYAVIGSAKIFFIDASGNNMYSRELTASEITSITNTETTAGGKSIIINGIPNTAQTLFMVANVKTTAGSTYPMIEGTTGADARLRIDKFQADVTHVPMSGRSNVFTKVSDKNYSASVTIAPLAARVEVGQITGRNRSGTAATESSDITEYKLSGVFVNNVRPYVLLNAVPYLVSAPIHIKSQAGWDAGWENYFKPSNTTFPYFGGGNPSSPADWVDNSMVTYCTPTTSAMSFYPDATNGATHIDPALTVKKAWAFQVCPSTTPVQGAPADVPHLIFKLTEVKYVGNDLGKSTQYLTVTKYKDTSNNPVTEFLRGNVYRIQNLIFSYEDATNVPYEENITVTATVSVEPWVINDINPDWN